MRSIELWLFRSVFMKAPAGHQANACSSGDPAAVIESPAGAPWIISLCATLTNYIGFIYCIALVKYYYAPLDQGRITKGFSSIEGCISIFLTANADRRAVSFTLAE